MTGAPSRPGSTRCRILRPGPAGWTCISFIAVRGSADARSPSLLVHGWPGSFIEFEEMLGPLTDPAAHGAPDAPAFHVVAPSLPGYAFSEKPAGPIGPRRMAGHIAALMGDVLGYDGYIAQGGDWGSVICGWIGHDHTDRQTAGRVRRRCISTCSASARRRNGKVAASNPSRRRTRKRTRGGARANAGG